jgi:hypothetical protein
MLWQENQTRLYTRGQATPVALEEYKMYSVIEGTN